MSVNNDAKRDSSNYFTGFNEGTNGDGSWR